MYALEWTTRWICVRMIGHYGTVLQWKIIWFFSKKLYIDLRCWKALIQIFDRYMCRRQTNFFVVYPITFVLWFGFVIQLQSSPHFVQYALFLFLSIIFFCLFFSVLFLSSSIISLHSPACAFFFPLAWNYLRRKKLTIFASANTRTANPLIAIVMSNLMLILSRWCQ